MDSTTIPFECQPPSTDLSNAAFLEALGRDLPDGGFLWTTAFAGDPGAVGDPTRWTGSARQRNAADRFVFGDIEVRSFNSYFVVSYFLQGHYGVSRSKSCFGGMLALVVDDLGDGIGGKIPWDRVAGRLPPSYILETSPGSFHMGYLLESPETDRAKAEAVLKAMVYQGLSLNEDPGMLSVTRYLRLPVGVNGKMAYQGEPGAGVGGFPVRVVHWAPQVRYSLDALVANYGLDLIVYQAQGNVAGTRGVRNEEVTDDIWYPAVNATGLLKGLPTPRGIGEQTEMWVDMTCPWRHEHTGGEDTGTAYCTTTQSFKCHHGHCQERTFVDLREFLLEPDQSGLAASQLAYQAYISERFGSADAMQEKLEVWAQAVRDATGTDTPSHEIHQPAVEGHSYEGLETQISALEPGNSTEARNARAYTIRCIAQAGGLTEGDIDSLLEAVNERTGVNKTALRKDFQSERKEVAKIQQAQRAVQAQAAAVADAPDAALPARPVITQSQWKDATEDGVPMPTTGNLELLVEKTGGMIRFNAMKMSEEAGGSYKTARWIAGNIDAALQRLSDWATVNGLVGMNPNKVYPMFRALAMQDCYHPFEEYLQGLAVGSGWDGFDRLRGFGGLFETVQVEDAHRELRDLVLTKWLFSIVAAARHLYKGRPGWQPRGVLVFAGEQYIGKSTWLAKLFQGLFPESHQCFQSGAHFTGTVDSKLELLSHLVVELGEVDATTKVDASILKAFLSGESDVLRRPYAKAAESFMRRTVFAGTVNVSFLKDDANTRFWSVPVTGFDLGSEHLIDLGQMWAQVDVECAAAMDQTKGGAFAPWHLSRADMKLVESVNEGFRVLSDPETFLLDAFSWDNKMWKDGDGRKCNPMTLSEVMSYGNDHHVRGGNALWKRALKKLTGQTAATHTSVKRRHGFGTGEPKPTHDRGKWWFLPPIAGSMTKEEMEDHLKKPDDD